MINPVVKKKNKLKIIIACLSGVLHCILSLYLWFFIVSELNIPTGPTFSPFVYYASLVIWFPATLLAMLHVLPVSSLFFPVLLVLNCIGVAFFLYRYLNRGEHHIRQEKDNIHSRPMSITIICLIFIITGALSLVIISMDIYNSPADLEAAESPISFLLHVVLIYTSLIIPIVSGVAMFKGRNWARLLYVGGMVMVCIIQMATSPMKAEMIPNVFFLLIIVFFLFRPQANRFFRAAQERSPAS